ncbi:MAG TPA: tRNA dihydrouridine synthase DusB [bacterium]|nr:tRNA dihydrouridine synthase DusB [bacterium]HPN31206.1 tRNA dihydrouridine synthase DusB [bacterium]
MNNFSLENPVVTAPLAGISDKPFRIMISSLKPALIFTEMVSVEGIIRNQSKTLKMLDFSNENYNIAVQIFGNNPEKICSAIDYIQTNVSGQIHSININMGCPVKKVVKSGYGAALLNSPELIEKIITKTAKVSKSFLTIKIRSGWNSNSLNYIEIGKIAENNGAAAVILHPRTAVQMYGGKSDWSHIGILKKNISIPVIGNGDILTYGDYVSKKNYCDYIMIGRGLLYNPFLITQISDGGSINYSKEVYKTYILNHLNLLKNQYGNSRAAKIFRKHFSWYLKNIKNAKSYREKGFEITNSDDFKNLINECF